MLRIDTDEKWLLDVAREVIVASGAHIVNVLDVGAATGRWTRYTYELLYKTPELRYHLFEPTREQFRELVDSYGHMPNISLNNFAISDRVGFAQIHVEPFTEHSSLIADGGELRTIPVFTVDAYCDFCRIERVSLMKVDVEGNEPQVIAGANNMLNERRIDCLQFEYGGRWEASLSDLIAKLHGYGYTVYQFNGSAVEEVEVGVDDFGYRNLLALVNPTRPSGLKWTEQEKTPLDSPAWRQLVEYYSDGDGNVLWPEDKVGGPERDA